MKEMYTLSQKVGLACVFAPFSVKDDTASLLLQPKSVLMVVFVFMNIVAWLKGWFSCYMVSIRRVCWESKKEEVSDFYLFCWR